MFEEITDVTNRIQGEVARRDFIGHFVKVGIGGLIVTLLPATVSSTVLPIAASPQDNWRQCNKCWTLFFNGFRTKGRCPKGGAHIKSTNDRNFKLTYDMPESAHRQINWRYCEKCQALFYNGFSKKGVCAGGGSHSAQGFNFALPHDTNVQGQRDWRFCQKCYVMFYDGENNKGVCAAGTFHSAQGYKFILDSSVRID